MWVKQKPIFKPKNYYYPTKNSRWVDKETGLRKNYDGTLERPEYMKIHRGKATKKEKQVMAKVMYEAGWGTKRLSEWFKVGPPTVLKWKELPTPEALQLFEQSFKAAMLDYDMQATFGIKSKIMQLVPESHSIKDLVEAGKFFSGEKEKRTTNNNTQVNIYADMLKKYSDNTTEVPVTILREVKK